MTGERAVTIFGGQGVPDACARVRPVEKAYSAQGLARERRGDPSLRAQGADGESKTSPSQFGTREPLWNGPRLKAAFVTQVLAQAFPHGDLRLRMAYRARSVRPGLLLDELV